jgi:hypothetical protein
MLVAVYSYLHISWVVLWGYVYRYITDTDHVYIRSATRDYMEEVNLVSDYSGKPIKIQVSEYM